MCKAQQDFISVNKNYLIIAEMYSPILFNWKNVLYFKIYGEANYAVCAEDGMIVKWNVSQHDKILREYPKETRNNGSYFL
jgi:hypothetical protein